jgi:hypothetical protein
MQITMTDAAVFHVDFDFFFSQEAWLVFKWF